MAASLCSRVLGLLRDEPVAPLLAIGGVVGSGMLSGRYSISIAFKSHDASETFAYCQMLLKCHKLIIFSFGT